jgi:hypothetical protein
MGYVTTDRLGYTGTAKRFATLADAQAGINEIAVYSVGQHDLSVDIYNQLPGYTNYAGITTAWWYTTQPNTNINPATGLVYPKDDPAGNRLISGSLNPSNGGIGFLQMVDSVAATLTSIDMSFSDFDGAYWTQFNLHATGANANYDNAYARFLIDNQGTAATRVCYYTYDLNLSVGGLQGAADGDWIVATNHPTSVTGTYRGLFENISPTYPQNHGFYTFDLTLNTNSWVYSQNPLDLNGNLTSSYFAVPEPAGMSLLVLGGLMTLRRK